MRRSRPKMTTALGPAALLLSALAVGCDTNPVLPPPPPELAALADPKSLTPVSSVAMILAPGTSVDRESWVRSARREAGQAKVLFSATRPALSDPADRQAVLIRAAARNGVSALLVEPVDAPGVAKALNDVRDAGTPVVLIGRRVASRDPARPFPLLVFEPFDGPARTLVGAVRAQNQGAGLPDDGHALIAFRAGSDPDAEAMAHRLEAALREGGVRDVAIVRLGEGDDQGKGQAQALLKARIEAEPKVTMVLAIENGVVNAALDAHDALRATREFSVAGTLSSDLGVSDALLSACAGLVIRDHHEFGRRAFQRALAVARGETVSATEEVPTPFQGRAAGIPAVRPPRGQGARVSPPGS